jgi:hypothetical protein
MPHQQKLLQNNPVYLLFAPRRSTLAENFKAYATAQQVTLFSSWLLENFVENKGVLTKLN